MKVDLHLHTHFSLDCATRVEDLIRACRERGLDAIAVTDHNTLAGAEAVKRSAPFPVILGEEIRTRRGEVLGLFLSEEIPRGLGLRETVDRIHQQGGIAGAPHPFDRIRRSALGERALGEILDKLDYLEVFNARCLFAWDNSRALALALERGIPMSAGSDAHTLGELGQAYLEVGPFTGPEEFLERLREGRIQGTLSSPLVHLASSWAKARSRLFNP
ncbi:MAG: PHP domain-containing protein [Anaerolineae bacterium]